MLLSRCSEAATLTYDAVLQRTPGALLLYHFVSPAIIVYLWQKKVPKRSGAIGELTEELIEDD